MESQARADTTNESTSSDLRESDLRSHQTSYNGANQNDEAIFDSLSRYPFDSDPEYINGLSAILGHSLTSPSVSEISQNADLVLQAQCFYFARKHGLPPIDHSAYRSWLQSRSSNATASPDASGQTSDLPSAAAQAEPATVSNASGGSAAAGTSDEQPPYPTSFAAIVDLITRNVPVPGIEEIPTTVLEHGSSKVDHMPRRKKPWETDAQSAEGTELHTVSNSEEDNDTGTRADNDRINGHLTTGEGVVKILQPNAIPDSGLLAEE